MNAAAVESVPGKVRVPRWLVALPFLGSALAVAGTVNSSDPFYQFLQAIQQYASGALGISIAIVALLFGAIVGIGRNQPTAALAGVAFAIFIYFGPKVIMSIFSAGAVLT
ncbi:MAG: TrbC/VirB2 family protein [Sinobacteraceae bacterium]|nr:TrbC/VirB2 family protein [Nevskiaceae bacterium]